MSNLLVVNEPICSRCGAPSTVRCSCQTNNDNVQPANDQAERNQGFGISKVAGAKTLMTGHARARKHAMDALDSATRGNFADAERSHLKAAKIHEEAADTFGEEGDRGEARKHRTAAHLHRKASVQHAIASINGLPNFTTDEDEMSINQRRQGLPPTMTLDELVNNFDDHARPTAGMVRNQSSGWLRYEGGYPADGLPLPVLNFDQNDFVPSFAFTEPSLSRGRPASSPEYGTAPSVRTVAEIVSDGMSDDELDAENRRRQGLPLVDYATPPRTIERIASQGLKVGEQDWPPRINWEEDWPGESVPMKRRKQQGS